VENSASCFVIFLHSLFFFFLVLWRQSYRSVALRDKKKLNTAEKNRGARELDEREAGFLIFSKRCRFNSNRHLLIVSVTVEPTPFF
jgi:hypothetical protein